MLLWTSIQSIITEAQERNKHIFKSIRLPSLYGFPPVLFLCLKLRNRLRKSTYIMSCSLHGFRRFSPWLIGPICLERHHGVGDGKRWHLYFIVEKKHKERLRTNINQFNSLGLKNEGGTSRIFQLIE